MAWKRKGQSQSERLHANLDYPVVDADGHFLEFSPVFKRQIEERVYDMAGARMRDRLVSEGLVPFDMAPDLSLAEHQRRWIAAKPWWGWPTGNVVDRATAHLPALLYERLDELGIDFTILYPSHGLAYKEVLDPELAQTVSRAINTLYKEQFEPYRDRMTAAAMIPMHTPDVAIEELEYAVNVLGCKTVLISGHVRRPIPAVHDAHPELFPAVCRLDTFGLDSEYDYDPLWAKFVELKVAPVSHSGLLFERPTRSVSNYMYNHINGIAHAHESLCKSLFMGGVTARFPTLRVGFLEGGVGWACGLLADLIGHWSKRNVSAMLENLDPKRLDLNALGVLVEEYGAPDVRTDWPSIEKGMKAIAAAGDVRDEWAACEISTPDELVSRFIPNFYFGCEADDPMTPWAFRSDGNARGARPRAMFSSDISHWDVPDMAEVFAEVYEPVEEGRMTERDLKEFIFLNAVRLHAGMNEDFFKGTVVEAAVAAAVGDGELA